MLELAMLSILMLLAHHNFIVLGRKRFRDR